MLAKAELNISIHLRLKINEKIEMHRYFKTVIKKAITVLGNVP